MELQPSESHLEALLARFVAGEASPTEQAQVERWTSVDPQNLQYLQQLQQTWDQLETVDPVYLERTDAAWQRFQRGVKSPIPLQARPEPRWRYLVAAAVVGLLIVSGLWLLQPSTPAVSIATVENTGKEVRELALSDGSALSLHHEAKVLVPDTFVGAERKVELVSGQAYFAVEPDTARPFIVAVQDLEVKVLGTEFEVNRNQASGDVSVSVAEGKVSLRLGEEQLILTAGEEGLYNASTGLLEERIQQNPNQMAWKTRRLVFERTRLSEVVAVLSDVYQQEIVLENPSLKDCLWSVQFQGEELSQVLAILAHTMDWEIVEEEGQFSIRGENCH
jgi:transmembrane sensor